MKKFVRALLLAACACAAVSSAYSTDYVSRLAENPELAKALGLEKLSEAERAAWNRVISAAIEAGGKATAPPSSTPNPRENRPRLEAEFNGRLWMSKADIKGKDIVQLANGAIFEVLGGYVGYGYGRDAAIIEEGRRVTLWVGGGREFAGRLLRAPQFGSATPFKRTTIVSVGASGALVKTGDGSVFEVDALGQVSSMLWLPGSEVLVLEDGRLICTDSSDEPVSAQKLK